MTVQPYPVAYIRRSFADADNPGDVSREVQEAAVRELAHRDGHNGNLHVYDDWNRSADFAKEAQRTGFQTMLTDMEAGRVTAIYSYALDRLYRSMGTFVRLTDAAAAHDVRIVTLREGVLGGDGGPMAKAFSQITAVFTELELNTIKARNRASTERRMARGDHMGQAPYGMKHQRMEDGKIVLVPDPEVSVQPVLDAYVAHGKNLKKTITWLNAQGIPSPRGKTWGTTALARVIQTNAPELLPPRIRLADRPLFDKDGEPVPAPQRNVTTRRIRARLPLSGLVRCHCGHMMTTNSTRKQYYCPRGWVGVHKGDGRYVVAQAKLLPWIKAEAARLHLPAEAVALEGVEGKRQEVQARLTRFGEAYGEGLIDRARLDVEKERAERELEQLAGVASLVELPPEIDWNWPTEELNRVLRALWRYVQLDRDMQPVAADWRVPEWRAV